MRPLDQATWPDFARLVERHNGVWGGCWCMAFQDDRVRRRDGTTPAQNRGHGRPLDLLVVPAQRGTVAMFEREGFERTRRIGKHHWVVAKVVG